MNHPISQTTKRVRLEKVVNLEVIVPPVWDFAGQRLNKLTQFIDCDCVIDVTLKGVLVDDTFELQVIGGFQDTPRGRAFGGYDVIAAGPPRPGLMAVVVHERSISPRISDRKAAPPVDPVAEGSSIPPSI